MKENRKRRGCGEERGEKEREGTKEWRGGDGKKRGESASPCIPLDGTSASSPATSFWLSARATPALQRRIRWGEEFRIESGFKQARRASTITKR